MIGDIGCAYDFIFLTLCIGSFCVKFLVDLLQSLPLAFLSFCIEEVAGFYFLFHHSYVRKGFPNLLDV